MLVNDLTVFRRLTERAVNLLSTTVCPYVDARCSSSGRSGRVAGDRESRQQCTNWVFGLLMDFKRHPLPLKPNGLTLRTGALFEAPAASYGASERRQICRSS